MAPRTVGQLANRAHGLELAAKVLRNVGCGANASSCEEAAKMLREMIEESYSSTDAPKNDNIMVTVLVPEGLRAEVTMFDVAGGIQQQVQTVVGGTAHDFFVDDVRQLYIKTDIPMFGHDLRNTPTADALDRKPDEA